MIAFILFNSRSTCHILRSVRQRPGGTACMRSGLDLGRVDSGLCPWDEGKKETPAPSTASKDGRRTSGVYEKDTTLAKVGLQV